MSLDEPTRVISGVAPSEPGRPSRKVRSLIRVSSVLRIAELPWKTSSRNAILACGSIPSVFIW